jgi:Tfp pilus assembly protein PilV
MTLVEVMLAAVILGIAAIGALSYEYHAAGHSKISRAQISGTRIARLLLEDWMITGGAADYDPTTLNLGFSADNDGYTIEVDGMPMTAALSCEDIEYDDTAEVTLRRLDVTVTFGESSSSAGDNKLKKVRPVILTTYVRTDASGG